MPNKEFYCIKGITIDLLIILIEVETLINKPFLSFNFNLGLYEFITLIGLAIRIIISL